MKRILFFSVMNGDAWGGSEEIWYQSALWLARKGYSVDVCCFDWDEKKEKLRSLQKAGCELYLLPGKKKSRGILGKFKLRKALKKISFDEYHKVILNQGGWKDVAYKPFTDLYKQLPPYQLIFHNYNIHEKFSPARHSSLQNWVNKAEKNFAAAGRIFTELEKAYSLSFPNSEVLFNPLTFAAPAAPTIYPGLKDGKYIFSVLAALDTERKAQDVLIQALSSSKWKGRNWELHLFGKGKDESSLERLIASQQMQSRIFLKGYTTQVEDIITNSHLILQLTHIDAMPISVIESLALARPVVVSATGDMPVWVTPGVNGWIADSVDVQAVDYVLEKAWENRENWARMGEQSFTNFQRQFPADPIPHFLSQAGII